MWTQERCVNPISKTKSKLYNLSEVGHLHPYIGARVEWFKESWVFAHRADVTVALAVTFDSPEVQRDWCAFPGPMTQQCKLVEQSCQDVLREQNVEFIYTHTKKSARSPHNFKKTTSVPHYPPYANGLCKTSPFYTNTVTIQVFWNVLLNLY